MVTLIELIGENNCFRSIHRYLRGLGLVLWLAASNTYASALVVSEEVTSALLDGRRTTTTSCFTDGTAKDAQKISALYGNFNAFYSLDASDGFGWGLAALGDINGDGVTDLAVGTPFDDDGGIDVGAVYVLFLETNGNVKDAQKVSALYGNLNAFYTLDAADQFGISEAGLGDIDGDSVGDLAVGAFYDDDSGSGAGAVYVLFLETNGNVKAAQKLSNLYGNVKAFYTLEASNYFGWGLAALGDLDGDGILDMAVGAHNDPDGSTGAGAVYVLFLETNGDVKTVQKISMLYGGFSAFYTLDASDHFGISEAGLGDVDGDGVLDLAVSAPYDDDGASSAGAVYVLFLETSGATKAAQKLSASYGNFGTFYNLDAADGFGWGVAAMGDIDGNGVGDMVVSARQDDDGVTDAGAVYVVFLVSDGTVKSAQKLSALYGNFGTFYTLDGSLLGGMVAVLGDVDGDGIADMAVGANYDNDGGTDAGSVYVINLKQSHCETPSPTTSPVPIPTTLPRPNPSNLPVPVPTALPIPSPSVLPVPAPTSLPVPVPTALPVPNPTVLPVPVPTALPIPSPSVLPVPAPTSLPVPAPTVLPVPNPSKLPAPVLTALPIPSPSVLPVPVPSSLPVPVPTTLPVPNPSKLPVPVPTALPIPTPSVLPVPAPSSLPVPVPTKLPVPNPSMLPVPVPTALPIPSPSVLPVPAPSSLPVPVPTKLPVPNPSKLPVPVPTALPIPSPSVLPVPAPTSQPTSPPVPLPTFQPTSQPTSAPSSLPTSQPTSNPLPLPTSLPLPSPTQQPTPVPSLSPVPEPTTLPFPLPTSLPISNPTALPQPLPTQEPTSSPTPLPVPQPTLHPTPLPTSEPTPEPTSLPTLSPTAHPSPVPIPSPTAKPTPLPTPLPTSQPTSDPTPLPSQQPTPLPTSEPTPEPTSQPTYLPTAHPSPVPIPSPTATPTLLPTPEPTSQPTEAPSAVPSLKPLPKPTEVPTPLPSSQPTLPPSPSPTSVPTTFNTVKVTYKLKLSGSSAQDLIEYNPQALATSIAKILNISVSKIKNLRLGNVTESSTRRQLADSEREEEESSEEQRELLTTTTTSTATSVEVKFDIVTDLTASGFADASTFVEATSAELSAALDDGSLQVLLESECNCNVVTESISFNIAKNYPTLPPTPLPTLSPTPAPSPQMCSYKFLSCGTSHIDTNVNHGS